MGDYYRDANNITNNCEMMTQNNPCGKIATPKLYVYYLSPEYITKEIHEIFWTDDDLFELAIIHHKDVDKMSLIDFQQRFNDDVISDKGYIIIK